MPKRTDDDEMDLVLPPGMPQPPSRTAPVEPAAATTSSSSPAPRARRSRAAAASPASKANFPVEFPTENPYSRDKRVPMNHRVLESIPARVAELSEQLTEAGYSPRQVSQSELIQAVLHFYLPTSVEDASELVRLWGALKAAPPGRG